MSEMNGKNDPNVPSKNRPEIQRYSVSKGKYSSRLGRNDHPKSSNTETPVERTAKTNFPAQEDKFSSSNRNEVERFDEEQRESPVEPENRREIVKKVETMTFENRNFTQENSSKTPRAGLIFLNKSEEKETRNNGKEFNNKSRKNSAPTTNQARPITQSSRGLTNVTRTLYDPNSPTMKFSPISVIQPATTNISTSLSIPSTTVAVETNSAQQDFNKNSFSTQEVRQQTQGATSTSIDNDGQNQQTKQRKQNLNVFLSQIQTLEKQLTIYLNNSPEMEENFSRMMKAKTALQETFTRAMLTNIESALSKNLDAQLWKICFHSVIESFRQLEKQSNENGRIKKCIEIVIEDAEKFFLDFIRELETNFNIDTKTYFNPNVFPPVLTDIVSKYALLCIQHCFLNLGDLCRYKETNRNGIDYSEARRFYQNARLLYPKNGKSCKQLAILAVMTHRRLDAIYFYVRALATTNLNDSVKQNLIVLFEEARRRLETFEKEIKEREKKNERKIRAGNEKVEIWKRNDGTIVGKSTDDGRDRDGSVSRQELIRWFILNYINLHGKLHTRTGMESFNEICSKMLRQFEKLLRHDPCVFGRHQLIQIMAINMYQIEVAKQIRTSVDIVVRSQYEESSLQLALDMFAILTEETSRVLERHLKNRSSNNRDENSPILNSWLKRVFPSLKIFTDWMTCNVNTFIPLPDQLPAELGPHPNVFKSLANVINRMRTIDRTQIPLHPTLQNADSVPVILEEDIEMSGFYPLLTLPANPVFTKSAVCLDDAKDCKRIGRLCFFADYLCGLEKAIFIYDVQSKVYRPSLICSNESAENCSSGEKDSKFGGESDRISHDQNSSASLAGSFEFSNSESSSNDFDMTELRRKKQILENQLAEKQKQEQAVKEILNTSRLIEIEVLPRFIVLDTNCFVNYLPTIQKIIKLNRFTIIIPLIVICELDKLSATICGEDDSYEHAEMVRRESIQAVKMIEECFARKERRVQAMTGEGTVLDSIQFRNEVKKNESNDDTILGCCLKYCHDNPRDFFPTNKDGPIRLFREVVLITDDRNLRLKAQARNVPVKDLNKFLELAQVNLEN